MAKAAKAKAPKKAKKPTRAPGTAPAMFAVKPKKAVKAPTPEALARTQRILAITARTRAAQRAIDELAAGADLSELAALPTMVATGPKRARPSWRTGLDRREPRDPDDEAPLRRKIADKQKGGGRLGAWHSEKSLVPKLSGTCRNCGEPSHPPTISCKELKAWLATSKFALARQPRAVVPVGQKRPISDRRVKTDSAVDSCPAPSPSP